MAADAPHQVRKAAPSRYRSGRRSVIALAVGVPVSLVFLVEAARGTSLGEITSAITGARPAPLSLAVAAMSGVYLLQAQRWRFIARAYGEIPLSSSTAYVVGGVAINNVVPGRPGEVARGHWVSRDLGLPWAKGFSTVVVDRTCDLLVLAALLLAVYEAVPNRVWIRDLAAATVVLGGGMVVALLACQWCVLRRGAGPIGDRSRDTWLARQVGLLVRGAAGLLTVRRSLAVACLSLGAWLMWATAAYAVAAALSIPFTITEALFVTAVVNLGVAIPSSPGFIGTYQWLCVEALGLFGVSADQSFAYAVLLHGVWFIPTTLAGLVVLAMSGIRRGRRLGMRNLASTYQRVTN